jgi:hypothetical protein
MQQAQESYSKNNQKKYPEHDSVIISNNFPRGSGEYNPLRKILTASIEKEMEEKQKDNRFSKQNYTVRQSKKGQGSIGNFNISAVKSGDIQLSEIEIMEENIELSNKVAQMESDLSKFEKNFKELNQKFILMESDFLVIKKSYPILIVTFIALIIMSSIALGKNS